MPKTPDYETHRREHTPERKSPDDIVVKPIDPAVVKVMPGAEPNPAQSDTQKLIEAGGRAGNILEGLRALSAAMAEMERFCHKEPRPLLPSDVAEMWRESRETLLVPLIAFAQTGNAAADYTACPTLQQLSGVGARMPEVVERLRFVRNAPLGWSVELLNAELSAIITFAEKGEDV